jgi:hypothetical protein
MVLSASLGLLLACNPVALPPQQPQTRAERSNYRETSSYADVVAFLRELMAGSRTMRLEWIGRSAQGRPMPLVVVADDPAITPLKARAENRLVVYVQANIHGGEVEGKEAALRILREIGGRERLARPSWDLTRTVLLVAPIYNIDGNERLGPLARNRPSQDGPDPVGERANGQGFDLNRDCMKAESPEMRAVLEHVYVRWDAHAIMDLHTTNGTRHGYELTYSPPLNPTTEDGVLRYSRDELLPKVRAAHRRATGRDLFDYGNAARPSSGPRWETFGFEPRYVTNYAGVRNRIGVLSEAASFQPFETRVEATVRFVWLVLEQLQRDSAKVVSICRRADEKMRTWAREPARAPELGVRFEMASRGKEKVLLEKASPNPPAARNKAPQDLELVEMEVFDRFRPTRTAPYPSVYIFSERDRAVAELLARHGALVERFAEPWSGTVESFSIREAAVAAQPFQGRRLIRLEGAFRPEAKRFKAGDFVVRTAQPLGVLLFNMLEPESLDGAIAWGFFGTSFTAGESAPVWKLREPIRASTEVFSPESWRAAGSEGKTRAAAGRLNP